MAQSKTRSRTFTGCGTCRTRHLKCDESRPICGNCRRLDLSCQGYVSQLSWIAEKGSSNVGSEKYRRSGTTAFRHPLFSEHERELMSYQLTASTDGQSTTKLLAQLDQDCEAPETWQSNGCLSKGPFVVFSFQKPGQAATSDAFDDLGSSGSDFVEEIPRSPNSDHLQDPSLLETSELFDADDVLGQSENEYLSFNLADQSQAETPWNSGMDFSGELSLTGLDDASLLDSSLDQDLLHLNTIPQSLPQLPAVGSITLPPDASFLLRYAREKFEDVARPKSRRKSPWEIMAVPSAMETFAELSIFNAASNSRLAGFFALLANNAFHLTRTKSNAQDSLYWRMAGTEYLGTARYYLVNAMQSETNQTSGDDYKQLLMAHIALATASLYHDPKSMSTFLIGAERLIRQQATSKPQKGFKSRMLHHVYGNLRIIAESFFVAKENSEGEDVYSPPLLAQNFPNASNMRKFTVSEEGLNAGLDFSSQKATEVGYNDLHLEVQGQWEPTLFLDIYGIPESLLTLLSQTVSLANAKKRLDKASLHNLRLSAALSNHVKTLESNIWNWEAVEHYGPETPPGMTKPRQDFSQDPSIKAMVLAIHEALLIYFYRRVHNVHAMMLQVFVRKVLNRLAPYLIEADEPDFSSTLVWPVLIAGTEAVNSDLQELALQCLTSIDSQGLASVSQNVTKLAQDVWERRKMLNDYTISWLDVVDLQ